MSEFEQDLSYHSTSDAELDSEAEEEARSKLLRGGNLAMNDDTSDPDDPQKLLNTWLGELDSLTGGLDSMSSVGQPLSDQLAVQAPRMDSYRFSMANLEESKDVELDAILGELCALESQFQQEISQGWPSSASTNSAPAHNTRTTVPPSRKYDASSSVTESEPGTKVDSARTESPDNDSAFSDNVSMLSSESSASSGGSGGRTDVPKSGVATTNASDAAAKAKAEKIRIALEKIREANVQKLFIKVFMSNGSSKSLLVDEKMNLLYITRLLADKNHVRMEPKWALVERLPDLHMERTYEDHENLVNNVLLWARDSKNEILFLEKPSKYELFVRPEHYLLAGSCSERDRELDDETRASLIEEFFGSSGVGVPEVEGPLYLKMEGKKVWKKYQFVLRASGLYYWPKGKSKSSRDLVCLANFEVNQVYQAIGWRKKYKAPTEFGFAIKHPQLQAKSAKYIRYLCTEDQQTLQRWVTGIRIAKHGRQLLDNYRLLVDDLVQEDLDQLASSRSFSISSVNNRQSVNVSDMPASAASLDQSDSSSQISSLLSMQHQDKRASTSESSSGCPSESSRSSTGTPTPTGEQGFESDFPPTGTIKRKPPSMMPKIPLTTTTRLIVKEANEGEPETHHTTRHSLRRSIAEDYRKRSSDSGTISRASSVSSHSQISSHSQVLPSVQQIYQMPALTQEEEERLVDSLPLPPPPAEFGMDPEAFPPPPPDFLVPLSNGEEEHTELPPMPPSPMQQIRKGPSPQVPPKPTSPMSIPNQHSVIYQSGTPANVCAQQPIYYQSATPTNAPCTVQVHHPPPPPPPASAKPPPPRRSDSTRLSSTQLPPPGKLNQPPENFLQDLHRVMQRKWQVSQKCQADCTGNTSPHLVLGFRDPPPAPPHYRESNVRAWLQAHYGSDLEQMNGWQTISSTHSSIQEVPSARPSQTLPGGGCKKRVPPPPPPKRSETTQLSTKIH